MMRDLLPDRRQQGRGLDLRRQAVGRKVQKIVGCRCHFQVLPPTRGRRVTFQVMRLTSSAAGSCPTPSWRSSPRAARSVESCIPRRAPQPLDELLVADFAAEHDAGLQAFAHDALRIGNADTGRLDHGGMAIEGLLDFLGADFPAADVHQIALPAGQVIIAVRRRDSRGRRCGASRRGARRASTRAASSTAASPCRRGRRFRPLGRRAGRGPRRRARPFPRSGWAGRSRPGGRDRRGTRETPPARPRSGHSDGRSAFAAAVP